MRILVVDDHLPTIELMRLTLTSFGHTVRSATNVADALELVAADRPDVVLSDLTFPGGAGREKGGYWLARALRSNPDHAATALLAITGVSSPLAVQAALDSGFDQVVVKPFDVELLIERIEELGTDRPTGSGLDRRRRK